MTDEAMPDRAAHESAQLLPATRDALLARHAAARRRRDNAPLDSEAFQAAAIEVSQIEVAISALDVADAGGALADAAPGARLHHS
jgi:hypothetical protein